MIKLTDNFQVNKPAPIDDRLGVFASTAEALSSIELDRRFIGLTVVVDTGSGATEYWFENGIQNGDFVAKSTGGGGTSWGSITGTLSNQTDLNTALNGKFDNPTGTTAQYLDGAGTPTTFPTSLPPTGNAGGDLTGTYPDPTVHRVHGVDFQSGTPNAGDIWIYGGSPAKWQHQALTNNEIPNSIDATKIANGNVSNTEFQYLDGVTSAIQTQINNKVTSNGAITGATKAKITYDSKGLVTAGADLTISDLPTTVPIGYSSPVASIVSGGVITETQLTTITIPAGAFKNGDNILFTVWGTRTSGASTGVTNTIITRMTNISGTQIVSVGTGNRHNVFTINARVLSDTSIIWYPNSLTATAVTTTTPSLASNGFTLFIGLTRTNTTDEFTLYNAIVRKYS